jgi:hypothetical protein
MIAVTESSGSLSVCVGVFVIVFVMIAVTESIDSNSVLIGFCFAINRQPVIYRLRFWWCQAYTLRLQHGQYCERRSYGLIFDHVLDGLGFSAAGDGIGVGTFRICDVFNTR